MLNAVLEKSLAQGAIFDGDNISWCNIMSQMSCKDRSHYTLPVSSKSYDITSAQAGA
jgi:hypothetical protein